MKKTHAICIAMFLLLCACEQENDPKVSNSQGEAENIQRLEKNLLNAQKTIDELQMEAAERNKQERELRSRYQILHDMVLQATETDFEYEVLVEEIERPPYDTVVYVPFSQVLSNEHEMFLTMRAALEFSGSDYRKVSIWQDKDTALSYIEGKYDSAESVLGWKGFDERVALIDNVSSPPRLTYYFSRDDLQPLELGKYQIPDPNPSETPPPPYPAPEVPACPNKPTDLNVWSQDDIMDYLNEIDAYIMKYVSGETPIKEPVEQTYECYFTQDLSKRIVQSLFVPDERGWRIPTGDAGYIFSVPGKGYEGSELTIDYDSNQITVLETYEVGMYSSIEYKIQLVEGKPIITDWLIN